MTDHLKQLEFYMHHFDIHLGYLINFPHDTGFPDVDDTTTFLQEVLTGSDAPLSDRKIRKRCTDEPVLIIKVTTVDQDSAATTTTDTTSD